MIVPLGILPAAVVPPRFFRVQFLAVLGLLVVAGLFLADRAGPLVWAAGGASAALALAGSVIWHTEEAPLGRALFFLTGLTLVALVVLVRGPGDWRIADDLAAALVLGGATSAMLMGHSY